MNDPTREAGVSTRTAAVSVKTGPEFGWIQQQVDDVAVHFKGYLHDSQRTLTGTSAIRLLTDRLATSGTDAALVLALAGMEGHFAAVLTSPRRTLAVVDRIRSTALLFGSRGDVVHIDSSGRRLASTLGQTCTDIDPKQALAVAASGYTIGAGTLYTGITSLRPGEVLLVDQSGTRTLRWFIFDAWNTTPIDRPEQKLSELHRFLIERLAASAAGRPIVVPLSAGLDSRMIAAGLKAVGCKRVLLFSYGVPGNREAQTARNIAEHLGFPWTFVPFTQALSRAKFSAPDHERLLWEQADVLTATPFEQDWPAIKALRETGYIPHDAIIVNGQSGDFITGNHAPLALIDTPAPDDVSARRKATIAPAITKHYRLWQSLATPATDALIEERLLAEASAAGADFKPGQHLHGIAEMLEYQDRQAKYVVSGQRTYEAFGLEWRLPLWDDANIQFWKNQPAELKRRQSLYRRVLIDDNWADVWHTIPVNPLRVRPYWLIPLRAALKIAVAPLGRSTWHDVERQVLGWWLDPVCNMAVVPYYRALFDKRGARNALAWITERYLAHHGLSLNTMIEKGEPT
jgi:asparagine synthase (glutamine-hydrolysing)